jgi:hypothetical protein
MRQSVDQVYDMLNADWSRRAKLYGTVRADEYGFEFLRRRTIKIRANLVRADISRGFETGENAAAGDTQKRDVARCQRFMLVGKIFLLQFRAVISRALEQNKDVALVAKQEKTWAWIIKCWRSPYDLFDKRFEHSSAPASSHERRKLSMLPARVGMSGTGSDLDRRSQRSTVVWR